MNIKKTNISTNIEHMLSPLSALVSHTQGATRTARHSGLRAIPLRIRRVKPWRFYPDRGGNVEQGGSATLPVTTAGSNWTSGFVRVSIDIIGKCIFFCEAN